VLITGTGTGIGKTWVSAQVLGLLRRRGATVAARKPAQSFDPGDDEASRTDAHILAAASGESPTVVCPPHRWYPRAEAPVMAARGLGRDPFTTAELAAEVSGSWPATGCDLGLVEGAGGARSPLAEDGDSLALASTLDVDVAVVVAGAGLGVINDVRLCAAAVSAAPLGAPIVFLNRFDPAADGGLHERNRRWLADVDAMAVVQSVPTLVELLTGG